MSDLIKKHRNSWKCKIKTEAVIWFACMELFSKKFGIIPRVIFIDEAFPEEDQELFESFMSALCEKHLGFAPTIETVNSKYEASVRLADYWLAIPTVYAGRYNGTMTIGWNTTQETG